MKRLLLGVALLTLIAAPGFAQDTTAPPAQAPQEERDRASVIDDVVRMTAAGVDDDAIVAFVRDRRNLYVVDADVLIALTEAHASKPVLQAILDNAYERTNDRPSERETVYVPYYGYNYWPYAYGPYWSYPYYWGVGWYGYGYGYRYGYGHGYGHGGHPGGGHPGGGRPGGGRPGVVPRR